MSKIAVPLGIKRFHHISIEVGVYECFDAHLGYRKRLWDRRFGYVAFVVEWTIWEDEELIWHDFIGKTTEDGDIYESRSYRITVLNIMFVLHKALTGL